MASALDLYGERRRTARRQPPREEMDHRPGRGGPLRDQSLDARQARGASGRASRGEGGSIAFARARSQRRAPRCRARGPNAVTDGDNPSRASPSPALAQAGKIRRVDGHVINMVVGDVYDARSSVEALVSDLLRRARTGTPPTQAASGCPGPPSASGAASRERRPSWHKVAAQPQGLATRAV